MKKNTRNYRHNDSGYSLSSSSGIMGNLALQQDFYPEEYTEHRRSGARDRRAVRQGQRVRKNREAARHMSFRYVFGFLVGMAVCSMVLVWYIGVQSSLTTYVKRIASLESELNVLKQDNDERANRIESNVDLERVRRVAIYELGMQYAEEGQIRSFTESGKDYVRQLDKINK